MKKRTNYDSPWKDILEQFLQDFVEFFLPEIANDIDMRKDLMKLM